MASETGAPAIALSDPTRAEDYQLFFDREIPPVMSVRPGDVFTVVTPDCACGAIRTASDLIASADAFIDHLGGLNFLFGPVQIDGARRGDVLRVNVVDIEPAPRTGEGFVATAPGIGALTNDNGLGIQDSLEPKTTICQVDRDRVIVPLDSGDTELPSRPFLGCIGVAPTRERRMTLSQSPDYVGDIDIRQLRAGASIFIRANHDGGLLSFGDVHAAQGDGELAGFAVEVEARVTLSVDLIPAGDSSLGALPVLADEHRVGVIAAFQGTSTATCIQAAGADLVRLLTRAGSSREDALQLMSVASRVRIGNAFEPFYSVFTSLRRENLPASISAAFPALSATV